VIRLLALCGNDRPPHALRFTPVGEPRVVALPDLPAFVLLNAPPDLELGIEKGGEQIGRQIARADVDPRVFVAWPLK